MSETLKPGEKISVIAAPDAELLIIGRGPGRVIVLHVTFLSYEPLRGMRHDMAWTDDRGLAGWSGSRYEVRPSEGLTWCRGWDAENVDAMLAAYALRERPVMDVVWLLGVLGPQGSAGGGGGGVVGGGGPVSPALNWMPK